MQRVKISGDSIAQFEMLSGRLELLRNEMVWKNFKLNDAEFHLNQIKESSSSNFHVLVAFHDLEIQLIRWILCPDDLLLRDIDTRCRDLSSNLRQIAKDIDSQYWGGSKASKVVAVEFRLIEAEVLMITAATEFQKKNYITAAHTLVKSNEIFMDLAQEIDEIRGKVEEAQTQSDKIISLCSRHLEGNEAVPQALLESLKCMIDEKTLDIRQRHSDRRNVVPEEILEATRQLLQLKQLYAQLSGKWRSSDGHAESALDGKEKNVDQKKVDHDAHDAEDKENVPNHRVVLSPLPSSTAFGSPAKKSPLRTFDVSPFKQPKSPERRVESKPLQAKVAVESPQKMAIASVTSFFPKMFSLSRLFPTAAMEMKPILPRRGNTDGSSSNAAKLKKKCRTRISELTDNAVDLEVESVDFKAMYNACNANFCDQQLVKALSRVHFAVALRNLLFVNSPKQLKWMLSILNLVPNVTQSLVTLYNIHNFEESKCSPFASLLLLNLPST